MTNTPLDHQLQKATSPSAKEIVRRLQKNGFYQVFETKRGGVEVKGQYPFECQVLQKKDGSWTSTVSAGMLTPHVFVPAVVFAMIALFIGFGGGIFMGICAVLGFVVGNQILSKKKKAVEERLAAAINDN